MNEMVFNDFIKLNRGFDLPNEKMVEGEYPVVASTNIKGYHNEFKIYPPCVVTGRSGSLGKVQYTKYKCWPLNTALYVKDYKGNYPRYVYYYLQIMHLENYDSGAGVPTLNQNHLHRVKIKVHDITSQKKVADILSNYDDLIEINNRKIYLLEKAAHEIYKEWFIRMRYPNYQNFHLNEGIPQGWEVKRLVDFGKIETGKTPPTANAENYGGRIMFIKTPDMHGQPYVVETGEYLTQIGHNTQPKKLLPANSISVSCIGTGGIVAINSEPAHTNQQINSIILNDPKYLEWLYFTAKALKPTIEMFGATGATMTNLSKGKFEKIKIICPSKELVYKYNQITSPMLEEIKELQKQNLNLVKQRDLLLPRLMNGKLMTQ